MYSTVSRYLCNATRLVVQAKIHLELSIDVFSGGVEYIHEHNRCPVKPRIRSGIICPGYMHTVGIYVCIYIVYHSQ